jgi:hypothetical protein
MRHINAILRKNRNIMYSILPAKKKKIVVTRDTLLAAGFSFSYSTDVQQSATGAIQYCYDFGYAIDSDSNIVIQRKV